MVPLVAIVEDMVVEGGMTKRASLMASKKPDGFESSGRPESTLAGRVDNLGAADKCEAGHGGHGLGGGGQGEGCVSSGGWATCFSGVFLPSVVRSGAIKKLSGSSSGRQMAPSLPKVDVGGFSPRDRWEVRFFVRYFISLVV